MTLAAPPLLKLQVGMICFWQSEWIEYALGSVYPWVDSIRIVYGPEKNLAEQGIKHDDTLEKIGNFPDPDDKITVIAQDSWESTTAMQKATLDTSYQPGYYLKLDGDEVVSKAFMQEFRTLVYSTAWFNRVPITCNYWHCVKDFGHIIASPEISEWRLRGFPITDDAAFTHTDLVKPYFDRVGAASLAMTERVHHYNWVRSLEAQVIHRASQEMLWNHQPWSWVTEWAERFQADPMMDHKVVDKAALTHPEIVLNHPYYPEGPDWSGPIDWSKING